jgi:hypothetical protein
MPNILDSLVANAQIAEHVEKLLKSQDGSSTSPEAVKAASIAVDTRTRQSQHHVPPTSYNPAEPSMGMANNPDMDRWHFNPESPPTGQIEEFNFNGNMTMNMNNVDSNFTWEMIGLGLEEPLPPQETIDELYASRALPGPRVMLTH